MAEISAQVVMDLRGRTGCGMMDCKKALAACDGDIEKAIDYLREKVDPACDYMIYSEMGGVYFFQFY